MAETPLPCPSCNDSLFPAAAVSAAVLFHCRNGHELSLEQLLAAPSSAIKKGLQGLLSEWIRQHQSMIECLEDARSHGYLDAAAIFKRRAERIESKIDKVRAAVSLYESSKLMKIPG